MVDDDREVSLTLADRDLVEPQACDAGQEIAALALVGHHPLADPPDCPPRDSHQLADRLLGGVDREPRDLVLKCRGEPRVVPGPRHHRDDHPVLLALNARRVGLKEAERRAEIQRAPAPATLSQVITRAAPPAMRAAVALAETRTDRNHDRAVSRDLDGLHDSLAQAEQPGPYSLVAHAATAPFIAFLTLRSRNPRSTAACAPLIPLGRAVPRPDLVAIQRGPTALSSSANHPQTRTTARDRQRSRRCLTDDGRDALPRDRVHFTHGNGRSAPFRPAVMRFSR